MTENHSFVTIQKSQGQSGRLERSQSIMVIITYLLSCQGNYHKTYMSVIVHFVVGQLDFVEADNLFHPLCTSARRLGLHVDSRSDGKRVGLACHQPGRAMVGIAITPVIDWDDVQVEGVLWGRVEVAEANTEAREHSPAKHTQKEKRTEKFG